MYCDLLEIIKFHDRPYNSLNFSNRENNREDGGGGKMKEFVFRVYQNMN